MPKKVARRMISASSSSSQQQQKQMETNNDAVEVVKENKVSGTTRSGRQRMAIHAFLKKKNPPIGSEHAEQQCLQEAALEKSTSINELPREPAGDNGVDLEITMETSGRNSSSSSSISVENENNSEFEFEDFISEGSVYTPNLDCDSDDSDCSIIEEPNPPCTITSTYPLFQKHLKRAIPSKESPMLQSQSDRIHSNAANGAKQRKIPTIEPLDATPPQVATCEIRAAGAAVMEIPSSSSIMTPRSRSSAVGGSVVWNFYSVDKLDQSKATCKICNKKISRGKAGSNLGTTSLRSHMNSRHKVIWDRYLNKNLALSTERNTNVMLPPTANDDGFNNTSRSSCSSSNQLLSNLVPSSGSTAVSKRQSTLQVAFESGQKYPPNHERVRQINFKVAKMLAIDMLPFKFVEGQGFRELMQSVVPRWQIPSRHYFSRKGVPEIHKIVLQNVGKQLEMSECNKVHITTDMWTSPQGADYMTVTAHWVSFAVSNDSNEYVSSRPMRRISYRKHATLCMNSFERKNHNAANILNKLNEVINDWFLPRSLTVGFVASDNGSNIVCALKNGQMIHVPCFAHILNLVVNKFLSDSTHIHDMLNASRKICSHFHRSYHAQNSLLTLQENNNLPRHQLIIDVSTRWNSTFDMLQRLYEQRKAIIEYLMTLRKTLDGVHLTSAQWHLMSDVCKVLQPFKEATLMVSEQDASLSQVLPLISLLETRLSSLHQVQDNCLSDSAEDENDIELFDLAQLGRKLILCLLKDPRIISIKKRDEYLLATLLDPRFKGQMYNFVDGKEHTVERCKGVLIYKVKQEIEINQRANSNNSTNQSSSSCTGSGRTSFPDCNSSESDSISDNSVCGGNSTNSLWGLFGKYGIMATGQDARLHEDNQCSAVQMVTAYMLDNTFIEPRSDPLSYWKSKKILWPELSHIAFQYLSCPPTSVQSERVFSAAGSVVTDHRNRLSSVNVDRLTFLKMNQHWIPEQHQLEAIRQNTTGSSDTDDDDPSEQRPIVFAVDTNM
ncbi:zinc finger BED domain-containing protein 6-like [Bombina bombina]|uniref:zinc finger BED domain-containing protein 6-like n=1 Tax=Bombina bombina TaxID=8345 RepID=UPI00235A8A8A|nr:zinc finger BED domain-containing protein 6-like [Bombina bombina]